MRKNQSVVTKLTRKQRRSRERGVALITALVLLLLLSGLVTAMVFSLRSDLMTNGYYRNFRGSFYAADSGLNVVREDFNNKLDSMVQAVNGTLALNTAPLSALDGGSTTVKNYINTTYGSSYKLAGQGATSTAANSYPESFAIDTTQTVFQLALPVATVGCTVSGGTGGLGAPGTCALPIGNPTIYTYTYNYAITSIGTSQGSEKTTLTDEGQLKFVVNLTPNGTSTTNSSFAAWGMFIDQQTICSGGDLVPGTINGPVFTNGSWNFGVNSTKYVFTDTVGSAGANAGYDFGGSGCDQVNGNSDTKGGNTIAPTFQKGFNRGQNSIPLPANSLNQEQAVLDGLGTASGSVSNTALNASVKNVSGTAYPTGGTSSGVYLPYSVNPVSGARTFTGGGIYVEGSADIKLQLGATSTQQVYKITQGGNVTTITVDTSGAGSTTISDSSHAAITITGVPMNNNASPATPGTSLYVDGAITSLTGPGEGQASIQDGTALTVTANGNLTLTGDLIYKTPPVDSTDALISGNNKGQVLGLFTANGNIQLNDTQKNSSGNFDGNMEIDASIAAIAQGGTGGLVNTGSSLSYLKIVGGRIQNTIQNINTSTRDVFFDRRFAGTFAPPFFPATTVTTTTVPTTDNAIPTSPAFARTRWINKSTVY